MGGPAGIARERWRLRSVPADLVERYVAEGWWTDATLGQTVADGLRANGSVAFHVRSKVRPWTGTLADVDDAARRLAGALHARGIGAGDVVVFQLPNWVEAGITFWAAAYLGATVVPIVHFYGPKEVDYILRAVEPDVLVTADRFGHTDHLATYTDVLARGAAPPWLVVGDTPAADLPAAAEPFAALLDADPLPEPIAVSPDQPAVIGFTSGTTSNPKGVVHSHRTIGCETRQLERMFPQGGPPLITGAPVGHFIGMLNAFLVPLLRDHPVNLVDVWDPAEVLRLMRDEGLGMGGGATYFLTSLLDHPDFSEADHLPLMPFAGLGGSTVPVAVTERADRLGIKVYRSYGSTEHPSITGCSLDDPVDKRLGTDGRTLAGVEIRLDDDGEISSRGPDCFLGYTDAELTGSVFDADGWYRTGDVGVLDADGYLTITDRLSDIIIRGGENISAQEIEELVLGLDGVAEVAVVAAPDERLGEHAAAVVRSLPGASVTLDDVKAHLAQAGLAKQKWPESLYVVADLPRTASGKVQKFRLRQQLRDGTLDPPS
jgi:acyl-CoA synthetase (AMP-forming)/AMP-acid ligase II